MQVTVTDLYKFVCEIGRKWMGRASETWNSAWFPQQLHENRRVSFAAIDWIFWVVVVLKISFPSFWWLFSFCWLGVPVGLFQRLKEQTTRQRTTRWKDDSNITEKYERTMLTNQRQYWTKKGKNTGKKTETYAECNMSNFKSQTISRSWGWYLDSLNKD